MYLILYLVTLLLFLSWHMWHTFIVAIAWQQLSTDHSFWRVWNTIRRIQRSLKSTQKSHTANKCVASTAKAPKDHPDVPQQHSEAPKEKPVASSMAFHIPQIQLPKSPGLTIQGRCCTCNVMHFELQRFHIPTVVFKQFGKYVTWSANFHC